MNEIDFVILWVDGNDPAWREEFVRTRQAENDDASEIRYRDWRNLHYWFRSAERFAPWVRKVHFITWGHLPAWLRRDHPKLHIVNHRDFIPAEYLPTFNSNTIELNIHRIEGLADRFVLFNDDTFLTRGCRPEDFFRRGVPCDMARLSVVQPSSVGHIIDRARKQGVPVQECDRRKLDRMSATGAHQGIIAQAAMREYASIEDILERAAERGEDPFIVVCDEIADPHNLGAILRTAECAGVHGVIIPKRRAAGLTAVVDKASAGAAEHMLVSRVTNIPAALGELKKKGLWVYGTAADAPADLWQTKMTGPAALVIGSEGFGMGRLVSEQCDFTVGIPLLGKITSLNASAAAAILMYEVVRQRRDS